MSKLKLILIILPISLGTTILFTNQKAEALSGSEFTAGNIIDDSLFYDGGAMTESQIQSFLNAKMPSCDTNGQISKSYYYNSSTGRVNNSSDSWITTSRAVYGQRYNAYHGVTYADAPFVCLRDYVQSSTPFKAGESGLCDAITAKSNRTAAQIINDVANACNVSQKAIIVMLQKEQGLVTDDWPWDLQYTKAMGYFCPDDPNNPGWCHPDYAGFFNQVYNAALQFQRYKADPHNWNHIPFANNNILYQANMPACGTKTVFIENYATAGLYNYTPYTPNQAALNNLYGTGDGCSAYGNRNFWRYYNDWFGTTRGSYLLRSVEDATVYMIVDDMKYPISDLNILTALYPLGQVKFVSQDYLNGKTTGSVVGRLIRSADGSIYFYDAGIKLAFTSCAMLEEYGFGAGCSVPYINLTEPMLQKFVNGPLMTQAFGTTSGKTFFIDNGQKREIYDNTAKQQAGINDAVNVLNEPALNYLSYGAPVMRDGVLIYTRGAADVYLYQQNQRNPITGSVYGETALANNLPKAYLDLASISQISQSSVLTGFIRNTANTQSYILDATGKVQVSDPSNWSGSFISVSDNVLSSLTNSSQPIDNKFVKSPSNGTVYYVDGTEKRPIHEWEDLVRMKPSPFAINTVSNTTLDNISTGDRLMGPGRLVKYSDNATVYMVDGGDGLVPISSFSVPHNLGTGGAVKTLSADVLDNFTKGTNVQVLNISCNSKNYIASDGYLREVTSGMQTHFGLTYMATDSIVCANTQGEGEALTRFLRIPNGTIFYIENSTKRPIGSYSKFLELGGNDSNTSSVSEFASNVIPTGQLIN